jgi:hypothetical protein
VIREKPAIVPICPLQISHGLGSNLGLSGDKSANNRLKTHSVWAECRAVCVKVSGMYINHCGLTPRKRQRRDNHISGEERVLLLVKELLHLCCNEGPVVIGRNKQTQTADGTKDKSCQLRTCDIRLNRWHTVVFYDYVLMT